MPLIKTVAIVANPVAGQGKGRAIAQQVRQSLEAEGMEAIVIFDLPTVKRGQLATVDAIVVIGGDGTLRAVASRCLEVRKDIPPLLPVPIGTANLMGRHLGIHWQTSDLDQQVVRSIQAGRIVTLDAARANGQLFLLMAGVGLDALIVHELDRMREGPINYASYVLPAALAIATYRYTPLELAVDGKMIFPSAPAMAFVANVSEYGTGFPIVPDARPDDGLLDVCVISVDSPMDALQKFLHAAAGEHVLAEGVVYARGKEVEVRSPQPVPVQIDGDPAGHTPLRIDVLPMRVPFIVPASGDSK
ncbi:MAG TPA: diacylglycerol kinase family protein [Tepidisphaeraceae bacterium]|jgi:YegS/Rv2252/BmrU family lipid kinase|nr:diacylglycerol kinase family protein [Tepidisphaeraceae bacterium]